MSIMLNRLISGEGEVIGYFEDNRTGGEAMQAARIEWDTRPQEDRSPIRCRSIATPIGQLLPEAVDAGDGDRVEYFGPHLHPCDLQQRVEKARRVWLDCGAASVNISRFEVNRYRRPGKSWRSEELGGPVDGAGVLFRLVVRAPK